MGWWRYLCSASASPSTRPVIEPRLDFHFYQATGILFLGITAILAAVVLDDRRQRFAGLADLAEPQGNEASADSSSDTASLDDVRPKRTVPDPDAALNSPERSSQDRAEKQNSV
jgi:hypothetical protein